MKQQFVSLLIASSLILVSCQREVISNEDVIASKANSNRNNAENNVPFIGNYVTTAQFPVPGSFIRQIITGHGQSGKLFQ